MPVIKCCGCDKPVGPDDYPGIPKCFACVTAETTFNEPERKYVERSVTYDKPCKSCGLMHTTSPRARLTRGGLRPTCYACTKLERKERAEYINNNLRTTTSTK